MFLGGGVTYWLLRKDPRVPSILAWMARDVGAVQIQTRGTLAGNLATGSPAADGVPVLMALDGVDRGWCEVLKEGKSCFMALDGAERDACEEGMYPIKHVFWAN